MKQLRLLEFGDALARLLDSENPGALALYLNIETHKWLYVLACESGIPDPVASVRSDHGLETDGPEWVRIVVAIDPPDPAAA